MVEYYFLISDIKVMVYVICSLAILILVNYIIGKVYRYEYVVVSYILQVIFYIYVGVIVINIWLGGGE